MDYSFYFAQPPTIQIQLNNSITSAANSACQGFYDELENESSWTQVLAQIKIIIERKARHPMFEHSDILT